MAVPRLAGRVDDPALPTRSWLGAYAGSFTTCEVNSSFYRLPDRDTFARWADAVPPDFRFAVKASRYLTHVRRLREPREPVDRLLQAAAGLGARLDTVLLQLPPDLRRDDDRLAACLAAFDARVPCRGRVPPSQLVRPCGVRRAR